MGVCYSGQLPVYLCNTVKIIQLTIYNLKLVSVLLHTRSNLRESRLKMHKYDLILFYLKYFHFHQNNRELILLVVIELVALFAQVDCLFCYIVLFSLPGKCSFFFTKNHYYFIIILHYSSLISKSCQLVFIEFQSSLAILYERQANFHFFLFINCKRQALLQKT